MFELLPILTISPSAGRSSVGTAPSGVLSDRAEKVRSKPGRAWRGDEEIMLVDDVGCGVG